MPFQLFMQELDPFFWVSHVRNFAIKNYYISFQKYALFNFGYYILPRLLHIICKRSF